jgi:hypothetical protein
MGARTTVAGSSELGIRLSDPQRDRIANWIPAASGTIDGGGEHDTSSTFSQFDAFTDDTETAYLDAQTPAGSIVEGGTDMASIPDGPDPDIVIHLIKYWKKSAKSKFDAGDYGAAEMYLGKIIKSSEIIHGASFQGRAEIVQLLVLSLSQQGKWEETHALLSEKFDGREETMEQIVADCRQQGNWEEAEYMLRNLWNHPTEPRDNQSRSQKMLRLKQAFAEVYLGKKDYPNAEKWCHLAVREIKANVGMKHPSFFGAIYLLAEIHKAKGDIAEMEAYRSLVPPEFCGIIH